VSSNLLPAFVALGSNLGDSSQIINAALDHLQSLSYGEFARSNVIVTDPVDCPPGSGKDCNAAARLDLPEEVSVLDWMDRLLEIEAEFGLRRRLTVNEPRALDLDWIGFGSRIIQLPPKLILPHPRAQQRSFVLKPLSEVSGSWRFPDSGLTPVELMASGACLDSA
jgi:2-amino-4-hydroxy-6-hydroxymethyldihydropteridine diphosphokinase